MPIEKLPKATYEGKIKIGETELNCAVLADGTRIISANAVFKAFGRVQRSNARLINMPAFLDAKNLQPFVGEDLMPLIKVIEYEAKNGKKELGFNALILPKICKVYLDAREEKNTETGKSVLTAKQLPLARASEILLLGLSNIGIIALVDEATGYQYQREKDELQTILKAYIAAELLPWQKRFPDEFYKEIFRLNGWDYTVNGIKQRPGVIGTWTKQLVYQQLPKGVLKELYSKTPKTTSGKLAARLHQSLTQDIGNPHLEKQLISVITLMNISKDWREFKKFFNKKFGQQELDFGEIEEVRKEIKKPALNNFDLNLKGLLSVPPMPKEKK